MQKLVKYSIKFNEFLSYINENLDKTNELSSQILVTISSGTGTCYTMLPISANREEICNFKTGNHTAIIDKEICHYVFSKMAGKRWSCIFDDVNVSMSDSFQDSFSLEYSVYYGNEVYYTMLRDKLSENVFLECMRASDAIWHSLCIITLFNLDDLIGKKLSQEAIREICANAVLVMIGAYDGEGYIFWEKES